MPDCVFRFLPLAALAKFYICVFPKPLFLPITLGLTLLSPLNQLSRFIEMICSFNLCFRRHFSFTKAQGICLCTVIMTVVVVDSGESRIAGNIATLVCTNPSLTPSRVGLPSAIEITANFAAEQCRV